MTTWKELITEEMEDQEEHWGLVQDCTLSEADLAKKFDNGYGGTEGRAFTVWTNNRVYFPVQYDGAEWCASVARHPDGVATEHIGGG